MDQLTARYVGIQLDCVRVAIRRYDIKGGVGKGQRVECPILQLKMF